MPIYEYACRKCRSRFEQLQRMNEKAACPKCGSAGVERLMSTFASLSPMAKCDTGAPSCAASKCASGMCGMRKNG